jgi:hypothetical protein
MPFAANDPPMTPFNIERADLHALLLEARAARGM